MKMPALIKPESVSIIAAVSGMPWSIAACAVSCRLRQANFATVTAPRDETETEAFPAIEGLNAHGLR